MRKMVLTTLLLVLVGAVAAAWLSSSTPSGSAIGDVNLAEDRIPGTGTIGFGVPPRQNPTAPGRSSYTAGGTARAASPESSLPVPESTIASSGPQAAYGAPTAFRQSLARNNANGSSGTRGRQARSASGSGGFSSPGFGGGGVGGGSVVARDPAPARERPAAAQERTASPAATPAPSASRPSPPSSGGGSSSGSPSAGGGSAAPPAAAVAAPIVALDPGPAVAPPVAGVAPRFSPGASPLASPTPEPTTMLLLGTGIAGLYRMRRYLE